MSTRKVNHFLEFMEFMSAIEAAEKWNVSDVTVSKWCRLGYVPGAIKTRSQWLIPQNLALEDVSRRPTGRPTENKQKTR
jgi:predicted site-specific integrase-resolvase